MKKILILYTSVGLGHKFIANNIGVRLKMGGFEVRLEDIGKVQQGKFVGAVTKSHQFINEHFPFIWSFLYHWGHYIILPFRVFIAGFNYRQTKKLVDEYRPDLIITVQTSASAVVAFLKQKGFYKKPFGIAFSDYHLHRYWLYPQADFYLANIEEQKQEMVRLGVPEEKIFVCGITLKPKSQIDPEQVKNKLGIKTDEKVILLSSGSLGTGLDEYLIRQLLSLPKTRLIIVCGKNEKIYQQIKQEHRDPNLILFGFCQSMEELYAIADVFVTKPGGLSTAEALRWHLPIVVSHWLPGQEELNINYLFKKNLILLGRKDLIGMVVSELETRGFKKFLSNNPDLEVILEPGQTAEKVVLKMLHGA